MPRSDMPPAAKGSVPFGNPIRNRPQENPPGALPGTGRARVPCTLQINAPMTGVLRTRQSWEPELGPSPATGEVGSGRRKDLLA